MDLGVYVPFGLGVLTASFLIWKFPLTVPCERIPMVIATFLGAYLQGRVKGKYRTNLRHAWENWY